MRRLTFQQLMTLQTRYLIIIARAKHLQLTDCALQYGEYMRTKIELKHKGVTK